MNQVLIGKMLKPKLLYGETQIPLAVLFGIPIPELIIDAIRVGAIDGAIYSDGEVWADEASLAEWHRAHPQPTQESAA